jgi:tRNA-modifying protein YgfZ
MSSGPGTPSQQGPQASAAAAAHLLLPELAVIRLSGDDATSFLHGQLTHDIKALPAGRVRLAGYCNPKGRLYALLQVLRDGDDWLLITARDLAETLIRRLRMFVLRARVRIEDVSDDGLLISLSGAAAEHAAPGQAPPAAGTVLEREGGFALGWPAGSTTLLLTERAHGDALLGELDARTPRAGPEVWQRLLIRAAEPWIVSATSEAFVPQQVNLERLGGVSFRKGCYPGQEVVARMHYLGKPSRRLYRLGGPEVARLGGVPDPGATLHDSAANPVAQVVIATTSEAGRLELLAVVPVKHVAAGTTLHCEGEPLEYLPMPYALD